MRSTHLGGAGDVNITSLAVSASGRLAAASYMTGEVTVDGDTWTSAGAFDGLLQIFDATGMLLWSRQFGDHEVQNLQAVAFDSTDHVVVVGVCGGEIDLGDGAVQCGPFGKAFIAKYDPTGNLVWKLVPAGATTRAWDVAVDGNDDVIVLGECSTGCDFGGGLWANGGDDVVVVRLASDGSFLWGHRYVDDNPAQSPTTVAVDTQGNVWFAGYFIENSNGTTIDFGGGALPSFGDADVFVAKLDAAGTHLFSQSYGGLGSDQAWGIALDANDQAYVVGLIGTDATFGGIDLVGEGGGDMLVFSLGADGDLAWAKSWGGTGDDVAWDIAVHPVSGVHVTGWFQQQMIVGSDTLVASGAEDIIQLELSATGAPMVSRRFGDSCTDFGRALANDANGGVFLAAHLSGAGASVDFGDNLAVTVAAPGFDAMIVQFP